MSTVLKYDGQELRACQPAVRTRGHFFIEGAARCQCGRVNAPRVPTEVGALGTSVGFFGAEKFIDMSEGSTEGDWMGLDLIILKTTRTIIVSAEVCIRYQFGRWEEQADHYVEELAQQYRVTKVRLRRLTGDGAALDRAG